MDGYSAAINVRAHAQSDRQSKATNATQTPGAPWLLLLLLLLRCCFLRCSTADADDAHTLRMSPLLVSLLHLQLHARTHTRHDQLPLAAEDACSGANGSLAAGDGSASLLVSREFDACLRVSESAAVRLVNRKLGIWVSGTELCSTVANAPFVLLIRQQSSGSVEQRKLKHVNARKIVMHLARRRTQADLH
ncbi:hypothetical protein Q7P35_012178 [Cladosporium inversicolor]